jgi:ComF family protein
LNFKFDNQAYIGYTFAEWLTKVIRQHNIQFDLIIPVPIHAKRYAQRGYNQSEIIGKVVAHNFHKRCETKVLIKTKNTVMQSTLKNEDRVKNILGAFSVRHTKRIESKNILLIDDVYTTGATVNECARVLKKFGAEKVIVLTVAYAHRKTIV